MSESAGGGGHSCQVGRHFPKVGTGRGNPLLQAGRLAAELLERQIRKGWAVGNASSGVEKWIGRTLSPIPTFKNSSHSLSLLFWA